MGASSNSPRGEGLCEGRHSHEYDRGVLESGKARYSGVYHSVSKKHLQGYLDEYSFRYSHRHDGKPMFKVFKTRISQGFVERYFPAKFHPRKISV